MWCMAGAISGYSVMAVLWAVCEAGNLGRLSDGGSSYRNVQTWRKNLAVSGVPGSPSCLCGLPVSPEKKHLRAMWRLISLYRLCQLPPTGSTLTKLGQWHDVD